MKRSVVRQSEKLAEPSKGGKRPVRRGRISKRVATPIGSLESGIPDLAENHRRYILKSLTKSE
jgi:hypothetical protein